MSLMYGSLLDSGRNRAVPWKASGDSQATATVSHDLKTLTVKGLCLDHVEQEFGTSQSYTLSGRIPTQRPKGEYFHLCAKHALEIFGEIGSAYESLEASQEALWEIVGPEHQQEELGGPF